MNRTWFKTNAAALLLLALGLALAVFGVLYALGPGAGKTAEDAIVIGGQTISPDATDIAAVMAAGETEQLSRLPKLHYADLSGSENVEEIAAWAKAHPEVSVRYTVTLPDGSVLPSDTRSYDYSKAAGAEVMAAAPALSLLPGLKTLKLGAERDSLRLDRVHELRQILPDTVFQYSFDLYGTACDLSAGTINLFHVPVDDDAARVDLAMACMPQLSYVDMDSCGVSNARMEQLHLKYPNVKLVWRVWFGRNYSVRTDVVRILASNPTNGGMLYNRDAEALSCCHDVRYLDLGHNKQLTDISFVRSMPNLEVAILAMCDWTDASPLADCPELEYLEMFSTECCDLTPLAGLQKLRHLNIATNVGITDLSPLYGLTDLERLWVGSYIRVPNEQVDEMRRHAPGCEINTSVYDDPTSGGWRYNRDGNMTERYYILRMQFEGYKSSAYSFSWNDPLCPKQ